MKVTRKHPTFGENADLYERHRPDYPKAVFRRLFSVLPTQRPLKILDLGCGSGKSTAGLLRPGVAVTCCDPDALMLKVARKKFAKNRHVTIVQARAEKLPFADESFDAITIGTALHWFNNPRALREIRRVLKAGGLLYVFGTLHQGKKLPPGLLHSYRHKPSTSKTKLNLTDMSAILKKLHLRGIQCFSSSFVQRQTVEERLGYFQTMSWYLVLPTNDRQDFLERARRALERERGSRRVLTYKRGAKVCYGWKPPRY